MFLTLADWLFGCSHRNTGFPITYRTQGGSREQSQSAETYVVCLDCGKRLAYDWANMRIIRQPAADSRRRAETESQASRPFPSMSGLLDRLVHHT